jgi:hypothetical protein
MAFILLFLFECQYYLYLTATAFRIYPNHFSWLVGERYKQIDLISAIFFAPKMRKKFAAIGRVWVQMCKNYALALI